MNALTKENAVNSVPRDYQGREIPQYGEDSQVPLTANSRKKSVDPRISSQVEDIEKELGEQSIKPFRDLFNYVANWTTDRKTMPVEEKDIIFEGEIEVNKGNVEGAAGKPQALETMSKVEYLVQRFFALFSKKAAAKLKEHQNSQIQYRMNYEGVTQKPEELSAPYQPSFEKTGEFMLIPNPKYQLVDKQALERSFTNHKRAAKLAMKEKLFEDVKEQEIPGVGMMCAYSFENGKKEGAVTPTCYWLGSKDEEAKKHLMNAYSIMVDNTEVAVLRSGKISTQEAADDLVTLLSDLHTKLAEGNPNFKFRVVSNQLNSYDLKTETSIIDNQHRWIAYANEKLKGKGEIIHINTPCNRFYHATKMIRQKLDAVGLSGIAQLIEKHVLTGEYLSKKQNLDSWGTYVRWLGEDLNEAFGKIKNNFKEMVFEDPLGQMTLSKAFADLKNKLESQRETERQLKKEIDDYLSQIRDFDAVIAENEKILKDKGTSSDEKTKAKNEIVDAKKQLLAQKPEVEKKREELRSVLTAQCEQLRIFQGRMEKLQSQLRMEGGDIQSTQEGKEALKYWNEEVKPKILEPVALMTELLENQLNLENVSKSPSRGRELLMIHLLHDKLGITSAINCKSGLDRTSFLHAVKLAMKQMTSLQGAPNVQYDPYPMVEQWDRATLALNRKMAGMDPNTFEKWIENVGLKDEAGMPIEAEVVKEIIEFRKMILDNLLRIGLPITKRSTGLEGLKWNPGVKENLVPLNFLPSHVMINGKPTPLVNYDPKTGEPTGVTETGRQLLTKFSGLRGS